MHSQGRARTCALLFIEVTISRWCCASCARPRPVDVSPGALMELASAELLYSRPLHPYAQGLFEAIPIADPDLQPARLTHVVPGEPPSAWTPPSGCVFHTRCPHVIALCRRQIPAWEAVGEGRYVACHRWRENLKGSPTIGIRGCWAGLGGTLFTVNEHRLRRAVPASNLRDIKPRPPQGLLSASRCRQAHRTIKRIAGQTS